MEYGWGHRRLEYAWVAAAWSSRHMPRRRRESPPSAMAPPESPPRAMGLRLGSPPRAIVADRGRCLPSELASPPGPQLATNFSSLAGFGRRDPASLVDLVLPRAVADELLPGAPLHDGGLLGMALPVRRALQSRCGRVSCHQAAAPVAGSPCLHALRVGLLSHPDKVDVERDCGSGQPSIGREGE